MITLKQLIEETGISRPTLAKYRDLGLIPKPQIVYRGYKKEGEQRGNEARYPSYTPWLINEISRLKEEGYTLSQILAKLPKIKRLMPKEELSEELTEGRLGEAALKLGRRLDELQPGYTQILVEFETNKKKRKIRMREAWGIKKA